jgi:hypothetical protein
MSSDVYNLQCSNKISLILEIVLLAEYKILSFLWIDKKTNRCFLSNSSLIQSNHCNTLREIKEMNSLFISRDFRQEMKADNFTYNPNDTTYLSEYNGWKRRNNY